MTLSKEDLEKFKPMELLKKTTPHNIPTFSRM